MPDAALAVSPAARGWYRDTLALSAPALLPSSTGKPRGKGAAPKLRPRPAEHAARCIVVGLPGGYTGLSRNMAMSLRGLHRIGIEPFAANIGAPPLPWRGGGPPTVTRALKRSVLLCHVNAELVPQLFRTMSRWLPEDALRIGFLLWETSRIAPVHELAMRLLDEIWVPTN